LRRGIVVGADDRTSTVAAPVARRRFRYRRPVEPANSCFVSYRRMDDEDADAFVRAFVRQLRKQAKLYLPNNPLFFDEQGLQPGDLLDKLGPALSRSASMVIFFLPHRNQRPRRSASRLLNV
jgi:hypothetical protein